MLLRVSICSGEDCGQQPGEAAIDVLEPQVVEMGVADNLDAEKSGVDHDFEMMRHAGLGSAQAEGAAGKVLFGSQQTYKLQAQRIA